MTGRRLLLVVPALACGAAAIAGHPYVSWGKAGVGFQQYRDDAATCGITGATVELKGRSSTDRVLAGTKAQDLILDGVISKGTLAETTANYSLEYHSHIRPGVKETQAFMADTVEGCLTKRGYRPFILNRGQIKSLSHLPMESIARRTFLHHLASDPVVLERQAVDRR